MRENIYNIYHRSLISIELNKGPKHDRKMGEKNNRQFIKKEIKMVLRHLEKHV